MRIESIDQLGIVRATRYTTRPLPQNLGLKHRTSAYSFKKKKHSSIFSCHLMFSSYSQQKRYKQRLQRPRFNALSLSGTSLAPPVFWVSRLGDWITMFWKESAREKPSIRTSQVWSNSFGKKLPKWNNESLMENHITKRFFIWGFLKSEYPCSSSIFSWDIPLQISQLLGYPVPPLWKPPFGQRPNVLPKPGSMVSHQGHACMVTPGLGGELHRIFPWWTPLFLVKSSETILKIIFMYIHYTTPLL